MNVIRERERSAICFASTEPHDEWKRSPQRASPIDDKSPLDYIFALCVYIFRLIINSRIEQMIKQLALVWCQVWLLRFKSHLTRSNVSERRDRNQFEEFVLVYFMSTERFIIKYQAGPKNFSLLIVCSSMTPGPKQTKNQQKRKINRPSCQWKNLCDVMKVIKFIMRLEFTRNLTLGVYLLNLFMELQDGIFSGGL